MRFVCILAVAALAFQDAPPQNPPQDLPENPEYRAWAAFKVGATAKYDHFKEVGDERVDSILTYRLAELTAEKAVLEIETTVVRNGPDATKPALEKREIPARGGFDERKYVVAEGDETLSLGDRKLKCRWVEIVRKEGDTKLRIKRWTCDEVPGHVVRLESRHEGPMPTVIRMMLTEFKS